MLTTTFHSPLGDILLAADAQGLTGLWFEGQKHFASTLDDVQARPVAGSDPESGAVTRGSFAAQDAAAQSVLDRTWAWLNAYFAGQEPRFTPPLHMMGTPFQREVWMELLSIPRGSTMSYGQIASRVSARHWNETDAARSVSPRAVGAAVARNPLGLIVPCHRVVAADGALTGYAAGLERKAALLEMEGALPASS